MRKIQAVLLLTLTVLTTLNAQKKDLKFDLYGFVRGDLFYNSRANAESNEGIFNLYPLNERLDANGEDLNAVSNSGFYMITTRLGVNISGQERVLGAKSFATIEGDFSGFGQSSTMFRIRQANIRFEWDKGSSVLFGQTWHPMFGDIAPQILNVSTGAPFQPFSRTPQIRYKHRFNRFSVSATAVFQFQYQSWGPDGKSAKYAKNAVIPELYFGADYKLENVLLTAGVDILTLKPRTESVVNEKTYKVNESITTPSFLIGASYTKDLLKIKAKSVLGQNLNHVTFNGGYGVSSIDSQTGKQEYTPFKTTTSWLHVSYGKKYEAGVYMGYSKILGTTKPLLSSSKVYGQGVDIDNQYYISGQFSYNIPNFRAGLEYAFNAVRYGDLDLDSGEVNGTNHVANNRILLIIAYLF